MSLQHLSLRHSSRCLPPLLPSCFLSHSLPFLDMGHLLCLLLLHAIRGMTSGRRKTPHADVAFGRVWAKQMSGRALRCWCHAACAQISLPPRPQGENWGVFFNLSVLHFLWQCEDNSAPVSELFHTLFVLSLQILVCIFSQSTCPPAPATFQVP